MSLKKLSNEKLQVLFGQIIIFVIPILLFAVITLLTTNKFFTSKILADNVLLYFGATVGSGLSAFIAFMGITITLEQKEKHSVNFTIEEALLNLYTLKTQINKMCNIVDFVYTSKISNDIKCNKLFMSMEGIDCIALVRTNTYKMVYFNEKLNKNELKNEVENIDKYIIELVESISDEKKIYMSDTDKDKRKIIIDSINEYINKLKNN